jgi:7,8-dihydroneopterin aldolase/epimerase/oxygenase
MADTILVEKLEAPARIGVTEAERAQPQRIAVSLALEPRADFSAIGDRLENTIDYARVCEAVKVVAAERARNLVETLAEEIAAALLSRFAIRAVEVEVRKFVLPETEFVGVRIRRGAVPSS